MTPIKVGTCAWSDHINFYPHGLKAAERLTYYARHFDVVEVDSTFYALQPAKNFERWAAATPHDFTFDVKAYRAITGHDRPGPSRSEVTESITRFLESIQPLRDAGKLRAVLLQFPPWFVCNRENSNYLRWCKDRFGDQTLAIEFRHTSWFTEERRSVTREMLRRNGMAHVICDEPQVGDGRVPLVANVTLPELAVVRLHGRNDETWYKKGLQTTGERFNYLYGEHELAEILASILPEVQEADEVHILMNNNFGNYAVRNALDVRRILGQPPKERADQGTLF
jgi:uncharacterized protein YecE (DUF72 family)